MEKPTVVNEYRATLGEGPCWDHERRKLWWIDGLSEFGRGNDLHCYDPRSDEDKCWHIGKHIGCAIPAADGRILLNLQDGIYLFDTGKQELEEISDLEREITNNRINDGKCDSRGRLWFGTMSMTANQPERKFEITGSFYKLEHDGRIRKYFGNVGISNGIAWNRDETKMYYVDTTPQSIYEFDFEVEAGEIANRTPIIEIDLAEGSPDGMTIDAEGMLWVAHFGGWKVSRWDPVRRKKLMEIPLPCAQVTCCAFGGKDMGTLYITTASIGLTEQEREQQPLAGAMFAVRPGVRGVTANKFRWRA
ncbi:SMP-30/gluconolactonase/LRE family protein [Ruminococcus gauvreauii]|uniref:SMP-30/gluconolactonase/LRE family protein n=1 Tax=Ruminococcus gauvreauii TaxID=438033 RepID=A0ABY5VDA0_9FIRM|nr:SMP-30/gluconolactonase/LRE family protein [Ruminococcus gauvreauii]UWP58292.1 SMP-30/gluconolactonase/LRE family protein [Ruminococcus gauvreauii]